MTEGAGSRAAVRELDGAPLVSGEQKEVIRFLPVCVETRPYPSPPLGTGGVTSFHQDLEDWLCGQW